MQYNFKSQLISWTKHTDTRLQLRDFRAFEPIGTTSARLRDCARRTDSMRKEMSSHDARVRYIKSLLNTPRS